MTNWYVLTIWILPFGNIDSAVIISFPVEFFGYSLCDATSWLLTGGLVEWVSGPNEVLAKCSPASMQQLSWR